MNENVKPQTGSMVSSLPPLSTLSLAQQVAQMVVVRAAGYLFDHQIQYPVWEPPAETLQSWIQEWGVGGVILLGGSAAEVALRVQQLQTWADIPLLVAADVEEGVGQRFAGATWFPPPMALSAIAAQSPDRGADYAEQMGRVTAQEARAIGLNWVLAPVVDVNNNPENPVINVRAFGETSAIVSQLATAFIRGAQSHPVLTTAKHFPGHGDTAIDSHLDLPILHHSRSRLQQVELPPFQAAITAGVDTIMSAHLLIPALDATYPGTLSHQILTEELRQGLGFEGLIVTDALVMGAIADRYGVTQAPVMAVEAGADILLMPANPVRAIQAVCEAVEAGRIPVDRIQASVERIWQAKQRVCLSSPTGLEAQPPLLTSQLAQPPAIAVMSDILRHSMQVHQPASSRLSQLRSASHKQNLILLDDSLSCDCLGQHTPAIALPAVLGYHLQVVDRYTPAMIPTSQTPEPTLLQLFIRGNPFRGSAGLTQTAQDWLQFLVQSDQLCGLIIYGSPYVLEKFLPTLPSEIPYVFTHGQMPEAQAIALNQLLQMPSPA